MICTSGHVRHTQCILSLVVHLCLDGVLCAEGGTYFFLFGNSDIMLFRQSLPINFIAAHHHGRRGVSSARGSHFCLTHQGLGGHSFRGVIHASDTGVNLFVNLVTSVA